MNLSAKTTAAVVVAATLASGCAQVQPALQNTGKAVLDAFEKAKGPALAGGAARNSLASTELAGVFSRNPITNGNNPERYPRVFVTIKTASPGVFKNQAITSTLQMTDCITFDARMWRNEKDSVQAENLSLCGSDVFALMKDMPALQIPNWGARQTWPGDRNTGAQRTDGPIPPVAFFPNEPHVQVMWMDRFCNCIFFVGAIMRQLGYNWNDLNDRRLWFVSVPTQPGR